MTAGPLGYAHRSEVSVIPRPRSSPLLVVVVLASVTVLTPAPVHAVTMDAFGRCLKEKGATFYGASWCPHCRNQRATLGDAMSHVKYVECSVDGHGGGAPACKSANVNSYPTWIFADGSRASGELSVAHLASKTGCTLPQGAERAGYAPEAPRPHAKIIEVPK